MKASADSNADAVCRISKTINRDWKFSYFPSAGEDLAPLQVGLVPGFDFAELTVVSPKKSQGDE